MISKSGFTGEWVGASSLSSNSTNSTADSKGPKKETSETFHSEVGGKITGDEAMARQYITKLLPAFTSLFLQQAMQPNMRKAALTLVRKMVHFTPPDLLMQLATKQGVEKEEGESSVDKYPECSPLAVQLVQVIAAVLDNEVRF